MWLKSFFTFIFQIKIIDFQLSDILLTISFNLSHSAHYHILQFLGCVLEISTGLMFLVSCLKMLGVSFRQIQAPQSWIWLFNVPFDYQTLLTKIIIVHSICLGDVSDIPVHHQMFCDIIYIQRWAFASLGRATVICPGVLRVWITMRQHG